MPLLRNSTPNLSTLDLSTLNLKPINNPAFTQDGVMNDDQGWCGPFVLSCVGVRRLVFVCMSEQAPVICPP